MKSSRSRAAGVFAAIVVAFVAVGALPGAASAGLQGKSASQIEAIALAAAKAKGSAHIVESGQFGPSSGTVTLDQSRVEGKEVDSGFTSGGNGTILFVKGVVYLKGDATYLTGIGLSAAQASTYAGQWISFQRGDTQYTMLADDETLVQTLKDGAPTAPLSKPVAARVGGQKVLKAVGGVSSTLTSEGVKGTNTAYVSDAPPYLPVGSVIKGTVGSLNVDVTTTLSKWGERVSLSVPAHSTPAASIIGS